MKKIILYILTIAAVFVFVSNHLFAQEVRKYDYKDFEGVSVGWGMKVTVSQASSYSVEVEADKRDLDVLEVEKHHGSLEFKINKHNYRKHGDINIDIKMPVLSNIDLSGGSIGKITMNIASKNFNAELSGGAVLKGELSCGDANFALSGGSTVKFTGKGENLNVEGSGGSIYTLKSFSVKNVTAELSGGSQVTVTMDGALSSDLSGGSTIVYYGRASMINNEASGGSGISKGK